MKKIFGIALVLAVLTSLCFGSVALADDPDTIVNINWGPGTSGPGSGLIGTTVIAGDDATVSFQTDGSAIAGSFNLVDDNMNTWYGGGNVDSVSSYMTAGVTNGYIWYQTTRTDTEIYHNPLTGQVSYSFVGASGSGEMATGSNSYGAGLHDNTWGKPRTSGGHNFEATGSSYQILRTMTAGDGDFTGVNAIGSGSAYMDCLWSGAYGGGQSYLAKGWGYTWDHDFNATGSGTFDLVAVGNNGATFNNVTMTGSTGGSFNWTGSLDVSGLPTVTATDAGSGASLNIIANFTSSFNMGDYSVRAW